MSRTNRDTEYANENARLVSHYRYRREEERAIDELKCEGYSITSNRQRCYSNRIANNWNDYDVSGYIETWREKEE